MDTFTLSIALVAGAVAAFNPCGFALLPAYLTVLVLGESQSAGGGTWSSVVRGARFSIGMTVGFVAVFGGFGLVFATFTTNVERYLPVVTIIIGVALIGLGVLTLMGRSIAISGLQGRGAGPTAAWGTQIQYGVTFALASLSCTIGPFLAVTSGTLLGGDFLEVVSAFVAYAVGMGAVVFALALATVLASGSVVARFRRAVPIIARVSGVLLIVAGAYIAWYGWFELRVLGGESVDDPIIAWALDIQRWLTRTVSEAGASAVLWTLGIVVALSGILWWSRSGRRTRKMA